MNIPVVRTICRAVSAGLLLLIAAAAGAGAQQTTTGEGREEIWGPVYNPETQSYFELRRIFLAQINYRSGPNWGEARDLAQKLFHNGTRGRLAIVRSPETHDFLLKNFPLTQHNAWIGLRLDCASRRLVWIDGTELAADGFVNWDLERWYNNPKIRCSTQATNSRFDYMGVYYLPREEAFRWRAAGQAKRWRAFFIEYPTGKP